MSGMIDGFEARRLRGDDVEIDALVGGSGPPLLLLHGFPQTRMLWKAVAPALAKRFSVVIPDLRGYGRSEKPEGDDAHERYAKRTMARDQIATMQALGHTRFAVAGHDRGARVAYRLALDHPEAVTKLAVLDIVPTADVFGAMNADSAFASYHWLFLAQARPLPETLIAADPGFYCRNKLERWAAKGFRFDEESMADYVASFSDPSAIHAACEDYRAGYTRDRAYDLADRGKKKIAAPVLALWGTDGLVAKAEPLATWRAWADDVRGHAVPGGHFVPEEAPAETLAAFAEFF